MPPPRSYAYTPPVAGPGFAASSDAWLDDLEKLAGIEVRDNIKLWIANRLDEHKLKSALLSSENKQLVYERLKEADLQKGIYQQRVVIDDYVNIPGVEKKVYINNGLPQTAIPASSFGVDDPAFDLPDRNAITFTGSATLVEIPPGEKLYRVTSDPDNDKYARTGGYWTRTPPTALSDVIGGTAVMPEWNNFQRVYEFTAPPYVDPVRKEPKFYVWEGPTAAQPVSGKYDDKTDNGYHLPGGDSQIFVPNKLSRDPDFGNHIQDVTHLHKSW